MPTVPWGVLLRSQALLKSNCGLSRVSTPANSAVCRDGGWLGPAFCTGPEVHSMWLPVPRSLVIHFNWWPRPATPRAHGSLPLGIVSLRSPPVIRKHQTDGEARHQGLLFNLMDNMGPKGGCGQVGRVRLPGRTVHLSLATRCQPQSSGALGPTSLHCATPLRRRVCPRRSLLATLRAFRPESFCSHLGANCKEQGT